MNKITRFTAFIATITLFLPSITSAMFNVSYDHFLTRAYYDSEVAKIAAVDYEHVLLYPDKYGYVLNEDTAYFKYIARSPFTDAKDLELNIYVVPVPLNNNEIKFQNVPQFDGKEDWQSCGYLDSPNAMLITSMPLGDIQRGEYLKGEFEVDISTQNGFIEAGIYNDRTMIVAEIADNRTFYPEWMQNKGITKTCAKIHDPIITTADKVNVDLSVENFNVDQMFFSRDEYDNNQQVTFSGVIENYGKAKPNTSVYACLVKRNLDQDHVAESGTFFDDPILFSNRCQEIIPNDLLPGSQKQVTFTYNIQSHIFRTGFEIVNDEHGIYFHDPNSQFMTGINEMVLEVKDISNDLFETDYTNNQQSLVVYIEE